MVQKVRIIFLSFIDTIQGYTIYSFSSLIGGIFSGYWATMIFDENLLQTGRVALLIINFGAWHIHIHHWIMGGVIIVAILFTNLLPICNKIRTYAKSDFLESEVRKREIAKHCLSMFLIGALMGIMMQDFWQDQTWYRVIYR